ncbi:MAG: hypothetical protein IK020_06875 [Clostridiales bacterium]|nr:hypothetical protein [Clostridiales bacterium]
MSELKETFPTTFVVLDMEWNQPIPYIPSPVDPKTLPGEIIDIGAVKLRMNSQNDFELSRPLRLTVRPIYYRVMNKQVSRVINKSTNDLKCGLPFQEAYKLFLDFCGDDYVLCAWGDSDISILRSNLKIHGLSAELNDRFMDIQPFFGKVGENTTMQRSVNYAVDFYRIPQTDDFHSADKDAWYEAMVLKESLIDYFSMKQSEEKNKENFIPLSSYISNPNLTMQFRWKSDVFPTEKEADESAEKEALFCPICNEKLSEDLPWFASGHTHFSLWKCSQHGYLTGKIRAKRTPDQKYYGAGQLRFANASSAWYVKEKWQSILTGQDITERKNDSETVGND